AERIASKVTEDVLCCGPIEDARLLEARIVERGAKMVEIVVQYLREHNRTASSTCPERSASTLIEHAERFSRPPVRLRAHCPSRRHGINDLVAKAMRLCIDQVHYKVVPYVVVGASIHKRRRQPRRHLEPQRAIAIWQL